MDGVALEFLVLTIQAFADTQKKELMPWLDPGDTFIDSDEDEFFDRTGSKGW